MYIYIYAYTYIYVYIWIWTQQEMRRCKSVRDTEPTGVRNPKPKKHSYAYRQHTKNNPTVQNLSYALDPDASFFLRAPTLPLLPSQVSFACSRCCRWDSSSARCCFLRTVLIRAGLDPLPPPSIYYSSQIQGLLFGYLGLANTCTMRSACAASCFLFSQRCIGEGSGAWVGGLRKERRPGLGLFCLKPVDESKQILSWVNGVSGYHPSHASRSDTSALGKFMRHHCCAQHVLTVSVCMHLFLNCDHVRSSLVFASRQKRSPFNTYVLWTHMSGFPECLQESVRGLFEQVLTLHFQLHI